MNTATVVTRLSLLDRIKGLLGKTGGLLRVAVEATGAPTMVSNPLRPSLVEQRALEQEAFGRFKGNNASVRDVDGDMHCSMDPRTELKWIAEHSLPQDQSRHLVPKKMEQLLQERRTRDDYPIVGSFMLDTKRLRMDYQGMEHVVRKVEFVTRRPDDQVPKNEHPEMSHEWHKYFLVHSEEGYIIDLVEG